MQVGLPSGVTDVDGPGCEHFFFKTGFFNALDEVLTIRVGGLLVIEVVCSSFTFPNSSKCQRRHGQEEGNLAFSGQALTTISYQGGAEILHHYHIWALQYRGG